MKVTGIYDGVIYMKATKENDFTPLPKDLKDVPDLIYICSPITLQEWQ